ncbi:uncharacterized protein EI90DRAFT_1759126 [Cantharellus anzutake]|uniref:uncharacterized protein n=1 Tax=Cantharellus anzutake TaxID=1750568 RepID=UPI001905D284|nr:uncharacterized protein EI90DRAFT_1759126 [Cantharellus anzutake]KAF8341612.1 hypothetical protein EI90DRAFT_1759126 [Cantharellus anzutake]
MCRHLGFNQYLVSRGLATHSPLLSLLMGGVATALDESPETSGNYVEACGGFEQAPVYVLRLAVLWPCINMCASSAICTSVISLYSPPGLRVN